MHSSMKAWLLAVATLFAFVWTSGCGDASLDSEVATAPASAPPPRQEVEPALRFELAADGPPFHHHNGNTGAFYMPELYGAGAALFDFDNDGDLDAYLVQGNALGPDASPDPALRDQLFRNDLGTGPDGAPRAVFTNVTAASGIQATGYGMGVAAGDYDGDGWVDLYVTAFGPNQLWRNRGDGTFEEVAAQARVEDPRWSVSTLFFDYDSDGWLDLYVGNYLSFSYATHRHCRAELGYRDYCSPAVFAPEPDQLWRNRGDGTFEDVSQRSGIGRVASAGLGAVAADYDGDGQLDLYVANDQLPNALWINQGDGTFRDEAAAAGCAVNALGQAEASMGVEAADVDGDGDEDLVMSHLQGETHTLYINEGGLLFQDRTDAALLAAASWPFTGFGMAWADFDNDGGLDLFVADGDIKIIEDLRAAGDPQPYHQRNQLFRLGSGLRYTEVGEGAGDVLALSEVSRGVAAGDVDNDGDVDLLVTNNDGPARLFRNASRGGAWVGLRLRDASGHLDPSGVRLAVHRPDREPLWRRSRAGGSYGSASDPRFTIGLGAHRGPVSVEVHWPGGRRERFVEVPAGSYTLLVEGEGVAAGDVAGEVEEPRSL